MGGPIALLLARRHPDARRRPRRPGDGAGVERHAARAGCCGGCCRSPARGCAAGATGATSTGPCPSCSASTTRVEPYIPWLVSEMSRNDPFAMVDAGRALSRYDARPWASTLGVPAASLITTAGPPRAARPSSGRWPRRSAPRVRELAADHLAAAVAPARVRRADRRAGRARRPSARSPTGVARRRPASPDRRAAVDRRRLAGQPSQRVAQVGELVAGAPRR